MVAATGREAGRPTLWRFFWSPFPSMAPSCVIETLVTASAAGRRSRLGDYLAPRLGPFGGRGEKPMRHKRAGRGGAVPRLEYIEPNAAGIDIGATEIYVAVPPDRDPNPVRSFQTFTEDLEALAAWLLACCIRTVAMESTGVYWIPLFQILEARGIEVCLVQLSPRQACAGTQKRCSRLPVVAVFALGGIAARLLSTGGCHLPSAFAAAPPRGFGGNGGG